MIFLCGREGYREVDTGLPVAARGAADSASSVAPARWWAAPGRRPAGPGRAPVPDPRQVEATGGDVWGHPGHRPPPLLRVHPSRPVGTPAPGRGEPTRRCWSARLVTSRGRLDLSTGAEKGGSDRAKPRSSVASRAARSTSCPNAAGCRPKSGYGRASLLAMPTWSGTPTGGRGRRSRRPSTTAE
jgi:hypothetical protein